VHYVFEDIGDTATRLHYHEGATRGELESPFESAALEKLKALVEGG